MDIKIILGILAGIVTMAGAVPYLRDVLRKETKPSRATWTLLTLLLLISAFVQGELGTGWAIALVVGDIIATGAICAASFWYGHGGFELTDKICYVLWSATVVLWLGLDRPLLALQVGILADLIAMVPTFIKTVQNPDEESLNVYIGTAIAGFLGVFAATNLSYQNIVFPAYLCMVCLAEVVLILVVRRVKQRH